MLISFHQTVSKELLHVSIILPACLHHPKPRVWEWLDTCGDTFETWVWLSAQKWGWLNGLVIIAPPPSELVYKLCIQNSKSNRFTSSLLWSMSNLLKWSFCCLLQYHLKVWGWLDFWKKSLMLIKAPFIWSKSKTVKLWNIIFNIITQSWSFRNRSNMLICCSRNILDY